MAFRKKTTRSSSGRRRSMTRKKSRKTFSKGASRTHVKNVTKGRVMRGGFRL